MGALETSLIATTADGSERGIARRVDRRDENRKNAASEIVVQTRPGFVFAGKVVDESGAPIPNATVWVGDLRDLVDDGRKRRLSRRGRPRNAALEADRV